jgi:hypothetical protein
MSSIRSRQGFTGGIVIAKAVGPIRAETLALVHPPGTSVRLQSDPTSIRTFWRCTDQPVWLWGHSMRECSRNDLPLTAGELNAEQDAESIRQFRVDADAPKCPLSSSVHFAWTLQAVWSGVAHRSRRRDPIPIRCDVRRYSPMRPIVD